MGGGHNAPLIVPAVIANGASLSGVVDLQGGILVAIQMPTAWTAATLTLQAFHDPAAAAASFLEVQALNHLNGAGVVVQFAVAAGIFYTIGNSTVTDTSRCYSLAGLRYVKVRSGTVGVPVAQGAERIIRLWVKYL